MSNKNPSSSKSLHQSNTLNIHDDLEAQMNQIIDEYDSHYHHSDDAKNQQKKLEVDHTDYELFAVIAKEYDYKATSAYSGRMTSRANDTWFSAYVLKETQITGNCSDSQWYHFDRGQIEKVTIAEIQSIIKPCMVFYRRK